MLPGVECARRRRLHQSGGGGGGGGCSGNSTLSYDSTRRSFCLYTRNLQSIPSSPSSLQRQAHPDEKLGVEAREAKRRLDEKLTAHMKSENQKRKSLFRGLWQQLRS